MGVPLKEQREQGEAGSHPWAWLTFLTKLHGEDFLLAVCNMVSVDLGLSPLAGGQELSLEPPVNSTEVPAPPANKTTEESFSGDASTVEAKEEPAKDKVKKDEAPATILVPPAPDKKSEKEQKPAAPSEKGDESEGDLGGTLSSTPLTNGASSSAGQVPSQGVQEVRSPGPVGGQGSQQTTWQKLSARIKTLEWNVTLSTGFLEELSVKYIQQIEGLNQGVKEAQEGIQGLVRREGENREREERREREVERLAKEVRLLREEVENSREELLVGLFLLCLLLLLLVYITRLYSCSRCGTGS